ncbi:MAG: hypothetical protein AAB262_14245 [Elusimicrobiota bacterium]
MRYLRILAWAAAAFCLAVPLRAQVPGRINFQGKLLDTSNNPRNGPYDMTFRVFNLPTSGTSLWSETQTGVSVGNGVFSVQLGAVAPIAASVFASSAAYLEIQVGSEVGVPRQQLVTSPYAFTAQLASTATVAATALDLVSGDTDYIQNRSALQAGAVFYVSSATVGGPFTATGTVKLGGVSGVSDVTVQSDLVVSGNLTANGAGPHVFTGDILAGGDIKTVGGNILDSAGTSRIAIGGTILLNGNLSVPAGQNGVNFSTGVFFNGAASGDNYIAYPFQASTVLSPGNVVIITGANTVGTTTTAGSAAAIGFAVTSALGTNDTVWVAMSGIMTNAVSNAAIAFGARVCTSATAGRVQSCNVTGAPVGKALTGTTGGGQTLTVVMYTGN